MGRGETTDSAAEEAIRAILWEASNAKRSALANAIGPPSLLPPPPRPPPPPPPRPPQSTTSSDIASLSPSLISSNMGTYGSHGASMSTPPETALCGLNLDAKSHLPPPPFTGTNIDRIREVQTSSSHHSSPEARVLENSQQRLPAQPSLGAVGVYGSHYPNQNVDRSPRGTKKQLPLPPQPSQSSSVIVEDDTADINAPIESDVNANSGGAEHTATGPHGIGGRVHATRAFPRRDKTFAVVTSESSTEDHVLGNMSHSSHGAKRFENVAVETFSSGMVLEGSYELEKVSALIDWLPLWRL